MIHRLSFSLADHPFDRWLFAKNTLDPIALTEETQRADFRSLSHAFAHAILVPQLSFVPFIQRGAYVRVHQGGAGTPFHSDAGLGHGPDEENVWIALTPAVLHVVELGASESLAVDASFATNARQLAAAYSLIPGEALRFSSRCVHGVLPEQRQVTLDFRITPRINGAALLGCPFEALAAG